ncbi:packaged DNA stabilization gp4 family protein [Pseudorhodoferax sp. Leaf274]|uniref:packaged DNA stabilization gp4 family protein n=1 Tax=Pseudorhodoferax sp. Leaf274 TaxID=1736318 RepID=UPI000702A41C|nr:packaged DNA stabilization gp4 family protein [Pseudorhodoferax sp. Leaf274]KQP36133.1 hypothetical protein ASF44_16325 [Pseudorhodoferax sp. Leaf274]
MSWTKRALVSEAFSELGLAGYEFDLSPEEQIGALRRLDSMVAAWEEDGIRLGYLLPTSPEDSDPDDDSGIPDTAAETVYLQLAIRIGPSFGKALNATTRKVATDGYARLLRRASVVPQMSRPRVLAGAGNRGRAHGRVFLPQEIKRPPGFDQDGNHNFPE